MAMPPVSMFVLPGTLAQHCVWHFCTIKFTIPSDFLYKLGTRVCLFAHENECPHLDLIFQHKKEEPEEERYLAGTPSGKQMYRRYM
ncbi:hypothetical protein SUGI_1173920 [Cryptomeria japonica]|nr:hypothetical protein SUGI_1173920 [Cryptomeria japonica]